MAYRVVAFPCSCNSVPFNPPTNGRRPVDAMVNFGNASYLDSLLDWQSPIPYQRKCLFNEYLTLQFKTQANSTFPFYLNPAQLYICASKYDAAKNHPVPNITNLIPITTGTDYWGIQQAPYDSDPTIGNTQGLVSYMWSFKPSTYLTGGDADSGIYFLVFDNIDNVGGHNYWYSEPILIYGTDALTVFPQTLLFEATNNYNKNDIILNGWPNQGTRTVVMSQRVEADITAWDNKGVYMGMLQQNFQQLQTYSQSWDVFMLTVGYKPTGIPPMYLRQLAALMAMDVVQINDKYFTYDMGGEGSESPVSAWKIDRSSGFGRENLLLNATLPIRYKYSFNSEFFATDLKGRRAFTGSFTGSFT